jgi:hypothetical protein
MLMTTARAMIRGPKRKARRAPHGMQEDDQEVRNSSMESLSTPTDSKSQEER